LVAVLVAVFVGVIVGVFVAVFVGVLVGNASVIIAPPSGRPDTAIGLPVLWPPPAKLPASTVTA
jgi:hypothetical protein